MNVAAALFSATSAAPPSLFRDSDGALGLAALHAGPPRWYTPSSAIAAICAAAARASPRVPLTMFCAGGGVLYSAELPACFPLLLFFPLVLSPEETLSPLAAASLTEAAQEPHFAGLVGGPPGRALYVASVAAGGVALTLDPHVDVANEQLLRWSSFSPQPLTSFSPSLAVSFLLRDGGELRALVARLRERPLLSIAVVARREAGRAAASPARGAEAGDAGGEYDFADGGSGGDGGSEGGAAAGPRPAWGANFARRALAAMRALARAWGFSAEG